MSNTKNHTTSHNYGTCINLTTTISSTIKNINIVFAGCDCVNQQDRYIRDYESALGYAIRPYRIEVSTEEPCIICGFADLIKKNSHLQQKKQAVITITGADNLQSFRQTGSEKSELEVFLEGLLWIKNHMKTTPYSVVVWMSQEVYSAARFSALRYWDSKAPLFQFIDEEG